MHSLDFLRTNMSSIALSTKCCPTPSEAIADFQIGWAERPPRAGVQHVWRWTEEVARIFKANVFTIGSYQCSCR